MIQGTTRPLIATAANQMRDEPFDLAQLRELSHATAGELPPPAVLWLLEECGAREREVAALVSECQDRTAESEGLRQQLEVLRLRIRELARRAFPGEEVDHERARLEAAARSVC